MLAAFHGISRPLQQAGSQLPLALHCGDRKFDPPTSSLFLGDGAGVCATLTLLLVHALHLRSVCVRAIVKRTGITLPLFFDGWSVPFDAPRSRSRGGNSMQIRFPLQ